MSSHQGTLERLEMLKFAFDNPSTISLNPYGPIPFFFRNQLFHSIPSATSLSAAALSFPLGSKRILITGGNSGVGFEAAKKLLCEDAHVIITTRSAERGAEAQRKLKEATGRECEVWGLDMTSFESVRKAAQRAAEEGLDMAVLNVGAYHEIFERAAETGYELTLMVHVYATCLLALLLIPTLAASTNDTAVDTAARLLIVTSEAHCWSNPRETTVGEFLSALNAESTAYKPYHRYQLTKLAMTLWATELAQRINSSGKVVVGTVSPGYCVTGLFTGAKGQWLTRLLDWILARPAEKGARIYLQALTAPIEEVHGKFWSHGRIMGTSVWARSEMGVRFQKGLWTQVNAVLRERTEIEEWQGINGTT